MVFCSHCAKDVKADQQDDGNLCCTVCGKVLQNQFFSEEATFVKNSAGQSKLSGSFVKSVPNEFPASGQKRTLAKMKDLSNRLGVPSDHLPNQALRFYNKALGQNFTRGRKSELVHAACLYLAFRFEHKPYLLIDFSNLLSTNVYVLGAVFLQLCQLLRLGDHPIVQKPVDPSLFINKYTTSLLKQRNLAVTQTALNIVAGMKRDWMQTGRKPSGICGAAVYMAAKGFGYKHTKDDVLRIVHVCKATLTKRLVEFGNTDTSRLTIEELNAMAIEHQNIPIVKPNGGQFGDYLVCEHKDTGAAYFALGLCEKCYQEFKTLSGGLSGGSDPPAFQRAEKKRMKKTLPKESDHESHDLAKASEGQKQDLPASVLEGDDDESNGEDDETSAKSDDGESDRLSDIDDGEIDGYLLNNEDDKEFRRIIWEKQNREYVEEQAAKEAAAAAAKRAFEANFENGSDDLLAARELAASATAAVAKSRKEMRQKRALEAKSSGPALSAAEAARRMVTKRRLNSKVNLDKLNELFEDPVDVRNPKKVKFVDQEEDKSSSKVEEKKDDEFEDGDMGGEYGNNYYYNENEDGGYNYYYNEDDGSYY